MFQRLIRVSLVTVLVGLCSLVPVQSAAAQDDNGRADALSAKAHQISEDMTRWAEAAKLHEQSGLLRMKDDTRAYLSLAQAARLYYHAGDLEASEQMFEAAGERAREGGDVYNAAIAFLNAAAVAHENGRERDAQKLGWKGQKLSGSQLLNDEQRKSIASRYRVLATSRL